MGDEAFLSPTESSSHVRFTNSSIAVSNKTARRFVFVYLLSHSERSLAASRSVASERPALSSRAAAERNIGTNASARALPGSVWNRRMSSGVTAESARNSSLILIARHGEYQFDPMKLGFARGSTGC